MKTTERVMLTPAYVLHQRAWRESSRIIEIISPEHGRLGLVARGIRRPTSPLRGLLTPFRPLLLSWSLRGELGTLTQAESAGTAARLGGRCLMAAFYLNELLLCLIARHDPQAELYEHYASTLSMIADPAQLETGLRRFELQLLQTIGYGLNLERDAASGAPVVAEGLYRFEPERGLVHVEHRESSSLIVQGTTLHELAAGKFTDAERLREARKLLRAALDVQLGGRRLKTRDILRELARYGAITAMRS
jgi:DNA repair protein RecO (recombination protein O)